LEFARPSHWNINAIVYVSHRVTLLVDQWNSEESEESESDLESHTADDSNRQQTEVYCHERTRTSTWLGFI